MNTNAQVVSRIAGNLKSLTKDGRLPRRLALSIAQDKARFLMAQKLDEMTLFREEGIISTITCFELEQVPLIECDLVDVPHCKSVMRSVKKLPEGLFGKNGSGIIYVSSIDNTQKFDYTTTRKYRNIDKVRHIRNTSNYYTIQNGYLYLLNSEVEVVTIQMIALKKHEAETSSSCCSEDRICESYWNFEFVCPDRFLDLVIRDTLTELANIYRTSVEDTNPNLDSNQKGKTVE